MIRLIKKYLKGYGRAAVAAPLLKFVEAVLELMMPLVVSHMIDSGLGDGSVGTVVWSGVMLVAMSLVGLAFSLGCQYLASKAAVGFGCNMRRALYAHVQRLEPGVIDSVGTGPLLSRLTTDVAQAQQGFAMFLRLMLRAPFIAVGAIVMSIVVAPHLWYISLAAAALVFVALVIVMRVSVPRFNKVQRRLDAESQLTGETVKGERVIRAFDNESRSVDRFVRAADSHRKAATGAAVISCLLNPLASVVVNIAVVMTLWIGAGDVDTGAITQGELVALINYLTQILLALMAISLLMVLVSKALSSAARINEVLDLPECAEGAGALPDPDAPLVEFRRGRAGSDPAPRRGAGRHRHDGQRQVHHGGHAHAVLPRHRRRGARGGQQRQRLHRRAAVLARHARAPETAALLGYGALQSGLRRRHGRR